MICAFRSVLSSLSSVRKFSGEWHRTIYSEEKSLYIVHMHRYISSLRKHLLNIEEIFTFVWINAVVDYFCSTVSRITELSMEGYIVHVNGTQSL